MNLLDLDALRMDAIELTEWLEGVALELEEGVNIEKLKEEVKEQIKKAKIRSGSRNYTFRP